MIVDHDCEAIINDGEAMICDGRTMIAIICDGTMICDGGP